MDKEDREVQTIFIAIHFSNMESSETRYYRKSSIKKIIENNPDIKRIVEGNLPY